MTCRRPIADYRDVFARRNSEADILYDFGQIFSVGKTKISHFDGSVQIVGVGLIFGYFRHFIKENFQIFNERFY